MRAVLPAVLLAFALPACAADGERPAQPPAATTELTVEVTDARPQPVMVKLRCGDARACDEDRLVRLDAALRAASDHTRACTALYGGPERAHVSGRLRGRRVDLELTRTNGCGIADYDALFRALGRRPPLASP